MSPEPRRAAQPFDLRSGELPTSLERVFADPQTPILLLVAAEADELAARAAIALAEARASDGRSTVLADADLDAPRLHDLLDADNLEGLVDVFLFGASLRRIAVRAEGQSFDFAPAGAYAPDPAEVLQSPRWTGIAEELTGSDALLLVFLPAAAPGARALSRRVGRAVILGDDRSAERARLRLDPACRVLAIVEPTSGFVPGAVESQEPTGPEAAAARTLTEPVVIRAEKKRRRVSPVLLFALVLALAAAGWFAYQELTGASSSSAPGVATQPVPPGERGALLETTIPYTVAIELHQDMATAEERVLALSRAEPDVVFHLAPVSNLGSVYYRVDAGPVTDRESATALMRRLVDAGHISEMADYPLLPTTHAFDLGAYDTEGEARARVQALDAAGIPAYVVPQRYESGERRYRVYGGAYQNQSEAEVMREMLENAGEPARLIPRVGEPVV